MIDKLKLEKNERVRLQYEIGILKNLIHPNIVRLYEVYESKSTIVLVTELFDGKELFDEIIVREHFAEDDAAKVLQQLLQTIAYCHSQDIAHRDIKPENILIDTSQHDEIKLIDFGTSHHFLKNDHTMHQQYGTPFYVAPEVLKGTYTEKVDIWSIGVLLFILLSGRPPFNGGTNEQILDKVQKGKWSFSNKIWDSVSAEAKDLIEKLLAFNPDKRLSAMDALKHPWFELHTVKKLDKTCALKALKCLQVHQVSCLTLACVNTAFDADH